MILLFGATGFVGGTILRHLLKNGLAVTGLIRDGSKTGGLVALGCKAVVGDIFDSQTIRQALEGCEYLINAVGIIVEKGRETFEKVHFELVRTQVDAAREAGIKKFIQISALGTRAESASEYHKTKYKAEEFIRQSGLNYTIFQPSVIFGPGDGFINFFADFARKAPFLPVIGGGGASGVQPIYIEELAQMVRISLTEPRADRKTYRVGGPKSYSMRDIMKFICETTGRRRLIVSLPFPIARVQAFFMEKLMREPPLTRDQLKMLREDNTCSTEEIIRDFGIELSEMESIVRSYIK